ncbi:MAG: hypothetical protein ACXWQO_14975 [Bdellovibrionota bacterium]
MAIGTGVVWAATALARLHTTRSKLLILALVSFVQFAPLTLFFHSALFMPDSLALNLNILFLCFLFRCKSSLWYLPAAALGGAIGVLRSGQFAVTCIVSALLGPFIWKESGAPNRLSLTLSILAPALFLSATILYQALNSAPLLGTTNYSFIGGRSALVQILGQLDCEQIQTIPPDSVDQALLKASCKPGETKTLKSWELLWLGDTLFTRYEKAKGESRADSNKRYGSWLKRAVLLFPKETVYAAVMNFLVIYDLPVTYQFKLTLNTFSL